MCVLVSQIIKTHYFYDELFTVCSVLPTLRQKSVGVLRVLSAIRTEIRTCLDEAARNKRQTISR